MSLTLFRYLQSTILAAGVTLSLFYLMQALIHTDEFSLTDAPKGRLIDFVRLQEEISVDVNQRKPKKPPPPEEPPPEQPEVEFDNNVDKIGLDIGGVNITTRVNAGFGGGFTHDGDYLPIVKVAPIYPRRAQIRGIEGYVLLEFTVTATGSVRDPQIIESDPPYIFDNSAKQAALKFKYKPKVVNGEAIEVPGVQNLITFKLEK